MSNQLQIYEPIVRDTRPTEAEIRRRAYEIYRARNRDSGGEVSDWLQAERELKEKYRRIREYSAEPINVFA